jgi:hypothetical protein
MIGDERRRCNEKDADCRRRRQAIRKRQRGRLEFPERSSKNNKRLATVPVRGIIVTSTSADPRFDFVL